MLRASGEALSSTYQTDRMSLKPALEQGEVWSFGPYAPLCSYGRLRPTASERAFASPKHVL